jgi:NADPH-dependent curcumin reductase CurA
MNATVNRQILLVEKPSGKLGPEHFKMANGAVPEPKDGEVLLRSRYISLDAANRAWMHGATYRAAVEANTVMAGGGIAEVVSSKSPALKQGDIVFGDTGWQDFAALPAKQLTKMPKLEPMTHLLSVYGIAGLTAYFGLLHVGKPKAGETVVVSAAAGSVGSIVGQLPKSRDAMSSASRAARTNASGLLPNSASTPRSTTRTARPSRRCGRRRQKASTSISTMSAATFWKPASPR